MSKEQRESGKAWFGDKLKQLVYVTNADGNDSTLYAKEEGGSLTEFNGHRICFKIEIEEVNRWKEKYGHTEYRKGCHGKLYANGELVWECGGWDYDRVYKNITRFIDDMEEWWSYIIEGGSRFLNRIIHYEGQLFLIQRFILSQCSVIAVPCDKDGVVVEPLRRLPFMHDSIDDGDEIADDGYMYGDEATIKLGLQSVKIAYKVEKEIEERKEKEKQDNSLKHIDDEQGKDDQEP